MKKADKTKLISLDSLYHVNIPEAFLFDFDFFYDFS